MGFSSLFSFLFLLFSLKASELHVKVRLTGFMIKSKPTHLKFHSGQPRLQCQEWPNMQT